MIKKTMPELLSPAGNMKCAYAAINCGCDAVYVGGKKFSARNQADNFSLSELEELIDYAHLRGAKVYITVNTLYKNSELDSVMSFVGEAYSYGADALILQDIGIAALIKENYEGIALHASTQMTAHCANDVKFLKSVGFDRVVLSRELSLDEISKMTELDIETEVFIHGAVCSCFSGRCLFSSLTSGRSGNRGMCAQNCRHFYEMLDSGVTIERGYLLSAKDMITVDIIDDLAKTGITSLKIEGRMKSPEYVAVTTASYRAALRRLSANPVSSSVRVENNLERDLSAIFNRGGTFGSGFFRNYSGKNMMSIKTPKHTGRKIGRVVSVGKGVCTVKLDKGEQLIPGDGIEVITKSEPHIGTGINRLVPDGSKLDLDIRNESVVVTSGDLVCKSYDKELIDRARRDMKADIRKLPLYGEAVVVEGKLPNLTATYSGVHNLTVDSSDVDIDELRPVERAVTQSVSREKIIEQINKTGASRFTFEYLKSDIGDNVFVPVSVLNSLRRTVLNQMEKLVVLSYKRPLTKSGVKLASAMTCGFGKDRKISVSVKTPEQLEGALMSGVGRIYMELNKRTSALLDDMADRCHQKKIEFFAALPQIDRSVSLSNESVNEPKNSAVEICRNNFKELLLSSKVDGVLIRTWGQFWEYGGLKGKQIAADYTFNIFNRLSSCFIMQRADSFCLSPELSLREAAEISYQGSELIIYGRLPLTTAALCPVGLYKANKGSLPYCQCKDDERSYALKDNKGMIFPIYRDCENCVCNVLNSKDLFILNKWDQVSEHIKTEWLRIILNLETPSEAAEIISAHIKITEGYEADSGIKSLISKKTADGVTNGNLYRIAH